MKGRKKGKKEWTTLVWASQLFFPCSYLHNIHIYIYLYVDVYMFLHYIALYHIIWYYIILLYILYIMLYIILYIILYVILYDIILYYFILYYMISYYIFVLCLILLHCHFSNLFYRTCKIHKGHSIASHSVPAGPFMTNPPWCILKPGLTVVRPFF